METVKKLVGDTTKKTAEKAPETGAKNLLKEISRFNRMAQLVRVRARFLETLDVLQGTEFKNSADLENFENAKDFKLILKQGYNTEVLSVSNEFILQEFKEFMTAKITGKIAGIDAEILAD
jgi:hypothetical protein